jgi:hypothetical protein
MKTFTINAIIDKIIEFWTLPFVLSSYLTKIFGHWILSPSSDKRHTVGPHC